MKQIKITFFLFFLSTHVFADNNFYNEGLIFYEKKQLEKAKFKFEQDLVLNPKNEKSYLYLSKIFNFQKKNKLEEQNLNSAILLDPKNEEAIYNLAKLKLNKSDYKESKKLIEQALVLCKNYCQKSKELKKEIENSLKK
jgi:tetratricopeptide (TPR) repeat protein